MEEPTYSKISESEEYLLQKEFSDDGMPIPKRKKGFAATSFTVPAMLFVIICLLASNTILLLRNQTKFAKTHVVPSRSKYANLAYDTPVTYHNYTDYISHNMTLADNLWDNIDTAPLVVALSDDWATEHDIQISKFRFPWDEENKGLYFTKAYHGIHCLKVMRKGYLDLLRGEPMTQASGHILHCFDAIRQDMMCNADDTPMPTIDLPAYVGDGQTRMCRNWDQFVAWTKAPEQNACYHRWTDYKPPTKKIEMFGFCPEDSEYYPVMKAYFDKFGHHDPYEGYIPHAWHAAESPEE